VSDGWDQVGGITLERFAELCAACGDERDATRQTDLVARLGVAAEQWVGARDGWMARMHDPADGGRTTARFNSLYLAARSQFTTPPAQAFAAPGRPAGTTVAVQWSDGNQYQATVVQSHNGHTLVTFADGRQQWVPDSSLGP
jgi:hypothetical protein